MPKKSQLSLRVSLERITWEGVEVPVNLGPEWLEEWQAQEPDLGFTLGAPLTGVIRLERHGKAILVRGRLRLDMLLGCSRCLEEFRTEQEVEFDALLELGPPPGDEEEVELSAADLEVDYISGDEVDLEGIIKEQILLALPLKPLCKEDCAGLCRECGANRNIDTCTCAGGGFNRPFAGLDKIRP